MAAPLSTPASPMIHWSDAKPVLAAIAQGQLDALDAWLAPRGPVVATTLLIAASGTEWALSEVVKAVAACPDPAARAALMERLAPVLSVRVKGWASGWVTCFPEALAGPPDLVETFLARGAAWDVTLPVGAPAWTRLPRVGGTRAAAYLRQAHAATGPWSSRDLEAATRTAIDVGQGPALAALVECGAVVTRPWAHPGSGAAAGRWVVHPAPPPGASWSIADIQALPAAHALKNASENGFDLLEPVLEVLWRAGAFEPANGGVGLQEFMRSLRNPHPPRPILELFEQAQARWRTTHLQQHLPQPAPAPPAPRF